MEPFTVCTSPARSTFALTGCGWASSKLEGMDRRRVATSSVTQAPYGDVGDVDENDEMEVRVPVKAGLRQVVVTTVRSDGVRPEGLGPPRIPIWSEAYGEDPNAQLIVSLLLIGGPYDGRVPENSPSRRRIFICQPKSGSEEPACAAKILTTLALQAYRRPLTAEDTRTLLDFYQRGRENGTFDTGIKLALERMLVSPDFLFRIEADPERVLPERSIGCRTSSSPRDCLSSCGAAYPTLNCCSLPFRGSCMIRRCSNSRPAVCSPILGRAARLWPIFSTNGFRHVMCRC